MEAETRRPSVGDVRTEQDVLRWYWLRSELVDIARARGVSTSGSKLELTERLADHLGGRPPRTPRRRTSVDGLITPISGDSVIPPGQRCTQELRAYLTSVIGPGFRFDGVMRAHIANGGDTVDGVIARWYASRGEVNRTIAPQFEYNRFTRAWRAANPDGDRGDLLADWWVHRSQPRHPEAGAGRHPIDLV